MQATQQTFDPTLFERFLQIARERAGEWPITHGRQGMPGSYPAPDAGAPRVRRVAHAAY
jgi:hypothetical protein